MIHYFWEHYQFT